MILDQMEMEDIEFDDKGGATSSKGSFLDSSIPSVPYCDDILDMLERGQ